MTWKTEMGYLKSGLSKKDYIMHIINLSSHLTIHHWYTFTSITIDKTYFSVDPDYGYTTKLIQLFIILFYY